MAKAKRIRWECPNGKHAGVLGSTRPALDSTVRFCLPCSEEEGKLVRRVAPALERKRAASAVRTEAKQKAKRERLSLAAQDARSAVVVVDGKLTKVRVDHLLAEVWKLPTRRAEVPNMKVPSISVQRSASAKAVGRAYLWEDRITTTIGRVPYAQALGLVIHEAAHMIADGTGRYDRDHHGSLFRSVFRSLIAEWTGVPVTDPGGLDRYDFHDAMVRHLREHPRDDG